MFEITYQWHVETDLFKKNMSFLIKTKNIYIPVQRK